MFFTIEFLYFLIKHTIHFHSVPRSGIGGPIHTRTLHFTSYVGLKHLKIYTSA
jgi:hypothetical protein